MKKIIAWALMLAMCVTLFAGCSQKETPAENAPATEATEAAVSGLKDAVAYVKTIYKNDEGTVTGKDYQVVGSVPVGTERYEISWSVDVAEDVVAIVVAEDGFVTVDVNEASAEEVPYVLTATLTDGTDTQTLSWNHTLPAAMDVDGMTYTEIVDFAYTVEDGVTTEDTYRLFGTVSKIEDAWSDEYQNISVFITVDGREDMPIECYRLTGEGAKDLAIGDAITVEGNLTSYNGVKEFNKGCVLVGYGDHPDQKALVKAAFELAEGGALDYPSVLTGTIVAIPTAWSDEYGNITVDMDVDGKTVECYRLSGEGAKDLAVGDTITVAGVIKNYKGTVEFDAGCKLVPNEAYHSVKNALSAYKLQEGEAQEVTKTITGTISTVGTAWSDEYKNITVTIVVAGLEDYPIECFRLTGEGAEALAEGDEITVTGTLKNYSGTVEFDAGCTLG